MANLVENRLVIEGDESLVTQIIKDLNANGMDYFVPRPDYLTNDNYPETDLSEPNWLKWSYANWGTKWDMYEDSCIEDFNTLYFMTANDSASVFVQRMQDLFPQLAFFLRYKEEFGEPKEFIPTK